MLLPHGALATTFCVVVLPESCSLVIEPITSLQVGILHTMGSALTDDDNEPSWDPSDGTIYASRNVACDIRTHCGRAIAQSHMK